MGPIVNKLELAQIIQATGNMPLFDPLVGYLQHIQIKCDTTIVNIAPGSG